MSERAALVDADLQAIADWERWFRDAHEERLREFPDRHLVDEERRKVDVLATAITAERRANYLARTQP